MDKELFIPLKPRGDAKVNYDLGELTAAEDKCEPEVKIAPSYDELKKDLKAHQFLYLIQSDKDLVVKSVPYINGHGKTTNKTDYSFVTRYLICWVKTENHEFYMKRPIGSIFLYDYKKQHTKFAPKNKVIKLLNKGYFTVSGSYVGNHTRNKAFIESVIAQVKDYCDKHVKIEKVKKEKPTEVVEKVKKEKKEKKEKKPVEMEKVKKEKKPVEVEKVKKEKKEKKVIPTEVVEKVKKEKKGVPTEVIKKEKKEKVIEKVKKEKKPKSTKSMVTNLTLAS